MSKIIVDSAVIKPTKAKKIVVRKPGAVRLTAMCTQYGYNDCCCIPM